MSAGTVSLKARWNTPAAYPPDGTVGDMAGNVKCLPILAQHRGGSIEIVWTGTPTGTITIYASNSHDPSGTDRWNGTWNSINGLLTPALVAPAGSAGSYLITLEGLSFKAFYVDYTRSGGSGGISATHGRELP